MSGRSEFVERALARLLPSGPVRASPMFGVWGLLLGALDALFAVAVAAGYSWLFLFGDDPWPEVVGWVIPAFGLGVFAMVLLACVVSGLRAGRETGYFAALV